MSDLNSAAVVFVREVITEIYGQTTTDAEVSTVAGKIIKRFPSTEASRVQKAFEALQQQEN